MRNAAVRLARRTSAALLGMAVAAGLAASPARGQFQFPLESPTDYTFSGCDLGFAAVFGPGPRACLTVDISVGALAGVPGPWGANVAVSADFTTPWAWLDCGGTSCGPVHPLGISDLPPNDDAFHAPDCNIFVCAPGPTGYTLGTLVVSPGYVPPAVLVGAIYFGPSVAPGDFVLDPISGLPLPGVDAYVSRFTLAAVPVPATVPEPAAVALVAAGLALLAAASRRRRPPTR
jgi:hypothetical protein